MSTQSKKDIAQALALGATPTEVSQLLGASPQYISNLLQEDSFVALVEACRTGTKIEERKLLHETLDDGYDRLEELTLGKMLTKVEEGIENIALKDLLRVAQFANSQKRKATPTLAIPNDHNTQVVIVLPSHTVQAINTIEGTATFNETNQVISVDGRALSNMSIAGITAELESP